jgi:hypothetical protein
MEEALEVMFRSRLQDHADNKEMAVLTTYFNPCGYHNLRRNSGGSLSPLVRATAVGIYSGENIAIQPGTGFTTWPGGALFAVANN